MIPVSVLLVFCNSAATRARITMLADRRQPPVGDHTCHRFALAAAGLFALLAAAQTEFTVSSWLPGFMR